MGKDNRFSLECPFLEASLRKEFSARFGEDCSDREITLADMSPLNSDLGAGDGHLTLHGSRISSLLPLSVRSNLKSLFTNSNRIKDFSFLNELPSFCELDLGPSLLPSGKDENLNKSQGSSPYDSVQAACEGGRERNGNRGSESTLRVEELEGPQYLKPPQGNRSFPSFGNETPPKFTP